MHGLLVSMYSSQGPGSQGPGKPSTVFEGLAVPALVGVGAPVGAGPVEVEAVGVGSAILISIMFSTVIVNKVAYD